jgi:hypothetical protein
VHTACHPTLQHHNSYNRTGNHRQWNTVWPPDDGRKDARNMLRNNWLPIKSLIVASSWSHFYLLICTKFQICYFNVYFKFNTTSKFLYVEVYFYFLLSSNFCYKVRILRKEINLNCSCVSINRIVVWHGKSVCLSTLMFKHNGMTTIKIRFSHLLKYFPLFCFCLQFITPGH